MTTPKQDLTVEELHRIAKGAEQFDKWWKENRGYHSKYERYWQVVRFVANELGLLAAPLTGIEATPQKPEPSGTLFRHVKTGGLATRKF